jgi:HPt (histidine-containing phosphotransfer) domain-containing protein
MNGGEDHIMTAALMPMRFCEEQKRITLDEDHLGRMTMGDRRLEREVLAIFARQTALTLERISGAEPAAAAAAAHTLKGSARGVGAWRVGMAAEWLERAAAEDDEKAVQAAIAELEAASSEVRRAIGSRLNGRPGRSRRDETDWQAPGC